MITEEKVIQILTWSVDNQLFGTDISQCREVVKNRRVTKVPHAADKIAGIVNLRGEVVTVLELRKLLGYSAQKNETDYVIIRLKTGGQQVAIKADMVYDVIDIDRSRFEPPPSNMSEIETRFISSVVVTDKGLVIILNPEEIVIP